MSEIGVITEQGDLGLGFNPVKKKDQETINQNQSNIGAKIGEKKTDENNQK